MGKLVKVEDLENKAFSAGFLFYDVPTKNSRMANMLRRKLRAFAMWPNKSVVTFPWENAALVEGAVLEVREETGQDASAYMLPMTDASRPYLVPMIENAAQAEFDRLVKSLANRIAAIPANIKKAVAAEKMDINEVQKDTIRRRKQVFKQTKEKVEELVGHGVALRLQDKFAGWAQIARGVLETEAKMIQLLTDLASGTGTQQSIDGVLSSLMTTVVLSQKEAV